jgi:hypothetical protein
MFDVRCDRRRLLGGAVAAMTVLALAAVGPAVGASAAAGAVRTATVGAVEPAGGIWSPAIEVPGTAALNKDGNALTSSVSCRSAGNCSAVGGYEDAAGHFQAFVVSQTSGTWGTAVELPAAVGISSPSIALVACATAGNCAAGGTYRNASGFAQVFVVSQTSGTWGAPIEVPGTATLNKGNASVTSLSCATAGNCAVGGSYSDASGHQQVFVASQTSGTWGTAIEVPGTAALNTGGVATLTGMSCKSAGNCSAGGSYRTASSSQAFVVGETSGTWGAAIEVPGTAALNTGGVAQTSSVSCATAGNCAAGGTYRDASGHEQAFVANETSGTWRAAIEVPGTAALNTGGVAQTSSVSCATAGNCSAVGLYEVSGGAGEVFAVGETSGTWGSAIEIPGTAALNQGGSAELFSVSCGAAGTCSAGGWYTDAFHETEPFVVNETSGTWGSAIEVPGITTLNVGGNSQINSLSCGAAGNCSAGGYYKDASGHFQAFVVSEA